MTPGKRYRKAVREQAQAAKQEAVKPKPNPLEYTPSTGSGRCDINSGERNSVLIPGGMGQVVGHRLKFDPADANQGVFFVAEGGGATKAVVVGEAGRRVACPEPVEGAFVCARATIRL